MRKPKSYESSQPGPSARRKHAIAESSVGEREEIVRITAKQAFAMKLSDEELARLEALQENAELQESPGWRPARDLEQFRRWQDRHFPEMVQAFEEARWQWHEQNDPK